MEALARSVYLNTKQTIIHPFAQAPELSPWNWTGQIKGRDAPPVHAQSAILVSALTGEILFEQNADMLIPPASMTKLVGIYTALRAVESGEANLNDSVNLPPESWSRNIPPGSSLMFLGPGQQVSLDEILEGMAVVSGNDAAIALAYYISGSVPAFVERMNQEVRRLGLLDTHFVEPSGLSEHNQTTAREFASFSRVYIREFPEALERYHAKTRFAHPQPHNLLPGHTESPVYQRATNTMLETLSGCDGLKTGFIYESGFNITLTVERNGIRYIAVLMGGPGKSMREGSSLRSTDGTALMDWVYKNRNVRETVESVPIPLTVWAGREQGLWAIPAGSGYLITPANVELAIKTEVNHSITAPINAGEQVGMVKYTLNGETVHTVPLIADRNISTASLPIQFIDWLAERVSRHLSEILF